MRTLGTLVAGMILGAVAIALGVYFYFVTGRAPVATSAPPMPFEKKLAHQALSARIHREMPKTVPVQPDEPTLAAGALVYREHCAVCHGLPGQRVTLIAAGMYPVPPKLMEGERRHGRRARRELLESREWHSSDRHARLPARIV